MARNYFSRSGGGTMDVIDAGNAGWDDTQARIDGIMRKRAAYRAGPMIASGDYGGAAQEYGAAGFDTEAAQARGAADKAAETEYQHGRDAKADDLEKAKTNAAFLIQLSTGLEDFPEGQRLPHLQQALPIFQKLGINPTPFMSLTEDQLNNGNLRMFGAKVREAIGVRLGADGYGEYNPLTHEFKTLREPTQKAPGDIIPDPENPGEWIPNPAKVEFKKLTRAPPRGRSGGGGGVTPGVPAGFVLD